jgi:hypothetical protein
MDSLDFLGLVSRFGLETAIAHKVGFERHPLDNKPIRNAGVSRGHRNPDM